MACLAFLRKKLVLIKNLFIYDGATLLQKPFLKNTFFGIHPVVQYKFSPINALKLVFVESAFSATKVFF